MSGMALATLVLGAAGFFIAAARRKNMHLWLGSYLRQGRRPRSAGVTHVHFLFADHFEPYWGGADRARAHERVRLWCDSYPAMAGRHRDSDGRCPQHSYFYPEEEYDRELLDRLAELCRRGYGDVEVHLHHDNDTSGALREKLVRFKTLLYSRHGLLRRSPETGEIEYGFIHGNWALDNSRPDGRWCGVDDEITILRETGCYADFTLPSAPDVTQTRKINSLYFAAGRPGRNKSHDDGVDVAAGRWEDGKLLIVQGPLALNWRSRKWGLLPRIESAEISADNPPAPERIALWARQAVQVRGRPDHIFIKVHSHGTQDDNQKAFFEGGLLDRLYGGLEAFFRPEAGYRLHYVTAREMYEAVRGLSAGAARKDLAEASR